MYEKFPPHLKELLERSDKDLKRARETRRDVNIFLSDVSSMLKKDYAGMLVRKYQR